LAAHRAFGNPARTGEEVRRVWGWTLAGSVLLDLRVAVRGLRKSPGFACTAVLALALGIGAATAVFTVIDSIILQPLAHRDGGRLVALRERLRDEGDDPIGPNRRHVEVWTRRTRAFSGVSVPRNDSAALAMDAQPPRLAGAVIGKTIRIDNTPRRIVGAPPQRFHFPNSSRLRAFGSRRPGSSVSERDAAAQLNAVQHELSREIPAGKAFSQPGAFRAAIEPSRETVVSDSAALAAVLPARRAASIDPMDALRPEQRRTSEAYYPGINCILRQPVAR
jgi:hypothetical protein